MELAWKGYNQNKTASSDFQAFAVFLFKTHFLQGKYDQEITKRIDRSSNCV